MLNKWFLSEVQHVVSLGPWSISWSSRIKFGAYFHSVIKCGTIFLGNSSDSGKIFTLLRKIIRIMADAQPRMSCRSLCKELRILPLPFHYTGCHRRKGPNFGRVFLMLNYTDMTQNTYIQSWTVTEIMAREVWNFDSCYTLTDCQIHIETGRNMWFL